MTKKLKIRSKVARHTKEWTGKEDYEFHPLAERFPLLEGEEFEALADDIAANGQKETVKLYEGMILDGRNRYRACKARNIPCRFEHWTGPGEPADYVLSMNLHRRHLTLKARQALVIEFRQQGDSIRQIAEKLQTSVGSVHRDIEKATVPHGTVGGRELPTTIKGKDNKIRQARTPKRKPAPKSNGKTKNGKANDSANDTAKGERPKLADILGVVHRGLQEANEAEGLSMKASAVFFKVNGHRIRVTCKIL